MKNLSSVLSIQTPYGELSLSVQADTTNLNNLLPFINNPVMYTRYDEDDNRTLIYIKKDLIQSLRVFYTNFVLTDFKANATDFASSETKAFSGITFYKNYAEEFEEYNDFAYIPFESDYCVIEIYNWHLCKTSDVEDMYFTLDDDDFNYKEYYSTNSIEEALNNKVLAGFKLNNYAFRFVEIPKYDLDKVEIPQVNLFAKMYSALKLNFNNVEIVGEPTNSNFESLEVNLTQADIDNSSLYMLDNLVDYMAGDEDEFGRTVEIKLQSVIDFMSKTGLDSLILEDIEGTKLTLQTTASDTTLTITPTKETRKEIVYIHTINPDDFKDIESIMYYIPDDDEADIPDFSPAVASLFGEPPTTDSDASNEAVDFLRNNHIGIGF